MLSENLCTKLNGQIGLEFYSANLYLQMSAWCEYRGLSGAAKFLRAHSKEEMDHMQRLFDYIQGAGAMPELDHIEKPELNITTLKDIFEQTYEHEKLITAKINEIVGVSLEEKDFSTFNFFQWYVSEQHEEEKLFKGILDKIEIIGLDGRGLFMVDKEIGSLLNTKH